MSQYVDVIMMLEARDRRVRRQTELLEQYRMPLISFSMNIAGPVKNSPLIERGFSLGRKMLLDRLAGNGLRPVFSEEIRESTGCEGLYVVDAEAEQLKTISCAIEETSPVGRLFDMDVLDRDGRKLDRPVPRRCLICGMPAKACARSRTHSVEELQEATENLLRETFDRLDAETAAGLAVRALLYEVCVTPKPGLVDRNNNGSHRDMNIYTFLDSASALFPYFEKCVRTGRETAGLPAPETLCALRGAGMDAEQAMFRASGGVNTHKGAIFSMGLLCGALGRLDITAWKDPERILREAGAMAEGLSEKSFSSLSPENAVTAGQNMFLKYGIRGIRGEAEAGFPSVRDCGLPLLEKLLSEGKTIDEAGSAALISLIAAADDTNLLARGGPETRQRVLAGLRSRLDTPPFPGREELEKMDKAFIAENLSPGGSADLLALCWLLHFLREVE